MSLRGQFAGAFGGRPGALFLAEIVLGGLLPLVLLSRAAWRAHPTVLMYGALLTTMGVVLNRVDVVILAMNLKGARPQFAPEAYVPSIAEWGVSIGLIAAAIYLFGLGARRLPVLPSEPAEAGPAIP
jgi:formate dehydrogenase iron-sulfur subunit